MKISSLEKEKQEAILYITGVIVQKRSLFQLLVEMFGVIEDKT